MSRVVFICRQRTAPNESYLFSTEYLLNKYFTAENSWNNGQNENEIDYDSINCHISAVFPRLCSIIFCELIKNEREHCFRFLARPQINLTFLNLQICAYSLIENHSAS